MRCVNKVILVGYVGRDPEIRVTQSGVKIASFSVATGEQWKDKATGERKESTTWHNIVVFNEGLASVIEKYVKKGTALYVEGAQKTRKYTDKSGIDRWTTEVVLQPFNGQIVLLEGGGGERPPSADDASEYGEVRSRGAGGGSGGDPNDQILF